MSAPGRRLRFGAMSGVFAAAVAASAVLVTIIADRFDVRLDATATGEHRLSPRSRAILDRATDDFEVVVAADEGAIGAAGRAQLRDVMEVVRRGSDRVKLTILDAGAPGGAREFDALLARLAERDGPRIEEQRRILLEAATGAEDAAVAFEGIATDLVALQGRMTELSEAAERQRSYVAQRGSMARVACAGLVEAAAGAREKLAEPAGRLPVPGVDAAAKLLGGPLRDAAAQLASLSGDLAAYAAQEGGPVAARQAAGAIASRAVELQRRCAIGADVIARLTPLDISKVARAVEGGPVALVIGPERVGLSAIRLEDLFPAGASRADQRRRIEEVFITAIGRLANPIRPIVVLLHGEPATFFENEGLRTHLIGALLDRAALQGIDVVEWAAAIHPDPPSLAVLNPSGARPVVYAVLSTDSTAGAGGGYASGADRAAKLGARVKALVEQGRPVILSLAPSTLPSFGQVDPMTACLPLLGLEADTSRPLMRERFTVRGRVAETDHTVQPCEGTGTVLAAVGALPTFFPWPVELRAAELAPGAQIELLPLFRVDGEGVWGESEWLGVWQTPRDQRERIVDVPAKDSERDDGSGPWTIAYACERLAPGLSRPQRAIVVGANGWFIDEAAQRATEVDGSVVRLNPGNVELFEAGVLWLAGQDDLIAQSAEARAGARIGPMRAGAISAIRWATIAGLPLVILLTGAVWRVVRR